MRILRRGASVDYQNGQILRNATQNRQLELLKLLLGATPKASTLEYVWADAENLMDPAYQLDVFNILPKTDAISALIDQQLVRSAAGADGAVDICKLLLRHGALVSHGNELLEPMYRADRVRRHRHHRRRFNRQLVGLGNDTMR